MIATARPPARVRAAEVLAFLGLSAIVHVAAFSAAPQDGATSGGTGGEAQMSIAAASARMEEMVAAWDRPPAAPAPPGRTSAPNAGSAPPAQRTLPQAPDLIAVAPPAPTPERDAVPSLAAPAPRAAPASPSVPRPPSALPDARQAPRSEAPDIVAMRAPAVERPAPSRPTPQAAAPPEPTEAPAPVDSPEPPASETAARSSPLPQTRRTPRPAEAPVRETRTTETQQARAEQQARDGDGDANLDEQVAAGDGGSAEAGLAGAGASSLSEGDRISMQRAWGAQVRQDISRSQRNRRGRRSGEAVVALVVSRDGALRSHRLQRSSGDGRLDDAALSAVSAAAPFPPAPAGLDKPFYAFTLSIRFE